MLIIDCEVDAKRAGRRGPMVDEVAESRMDAF